MGVTCLGFLGALQDLFSEIFDTVLSPILRDVFNFIVDMLGSLLNDIFSGFFLMGWITVLKMIDFLETVFNVFAGLNNVQVTTGDVSEELPLLDYFFSISQIQKAFAIITLISVVLVFLTTLISVIKSISDMALEDKNPLSTVLKQAVKAAVSFLLIPFACLFLLNAVTGITVAISENVGNAEGTVSDALFITVAQPAIKNQNNVMKYSSGLKYEDIDAVKSDFNYKQFNYVQAYVSSVLVIFIMLCSVLQFIQRIFMILLLYLVSPFFVAYMPVDGGARFRAWRNMFVGHMVSAFGPILVMRIYLMIVPAVLNSNINFHTSSDFLTACVKLVFIIGGAFAVYKSRLLILSVVDSQAASSAAESGVIGAVVGGKIAGALGGGGRARSSSRGKSGK